MRNLSITVFIEYKKSSFSAVDKPTDFSCQTGQVRFRIYLLRLKFGCPQICMCLTKCKCKAKHWASKY